MNDENTDLELTPIAPERIREYDRATADITFVPQRTVNATATAAHPMEETVRILDGMMRANRVNQPINPVAFRQDFTVADGYGDDDITDPKDLGEFKEEYEDIRFLLFDMRGRDKSFSLMYSIYKGSQNVIGKRVRCDDGPMKYKIVSVEKFKYLRETKLKLDGGEVEAYRCGFDKTDLDLFAIRKRLSLKYMALSLNKILNTNADRLTSELKSLTEKLEFLISTMSLKSADEFKKQIKELKDLIKKEKDNTKKVGIKEFKDEIRKIQSFEGVKRVYMDLAGNLYVETNLLKARTWEHNKDLRKTLGRLLFKIQLSSTPGSTVINALNLTHNANGLFHPQIRDTEICWGNEKTTVQNFISSAELAIAVDYLMNFMSTTFQKDSTYFLDPEDWFYQKRKNPINFDIANFFYGYKKEDIWEMN